MKKMIIAFTCLIFSAGWAQTTTNTDTTTSRTYSETTTPERDSSGFFLEPAIFGSSNDTDFKASIAGADNTGTSRGFGLDLKLGAHLAEIFFLGADARYERSRFADSSYSDVDANTYNWGPVAGFQAPFFGLRVWGTYVVDGISDPDAGVQGLDFKFKDPYGWRVGAGIRLASVSLNVEYEDLTYRTTEVQSVGGFGVGQNTEADLTQRGYGVSIGFPIEL
jgi:hypothetical protein